MKNAFTMPLLFSIFLVFAIALRNGYGAPTSTVKSEKPLFVPSALTNPATTHATIYGTGRLESAAHYMPTFYDPSELLQRQHAYQPIERVLQILHHRGEKRKAGTEGANHVDEDDYERKANNLLSGEQLSPELEDLDRKYKRSAPYVAWNSPTLRTNTAAVNYEPNRAPVFNSRAVNVVPFGPYTTWSPYQGPLVASYAGPKSPAHSGRRRRHDNEGNEEDEGTRVDHPSPLQYAPAYNTYALFPANLEPHHMRFVRDMPLQYSVVYEPAYSGPCPSCHNLALLTNSLHANGAPGARADELEKFASPPY